MLDGLLGAPMVRPVSDPARAAREHAAGKGAPVVGASFQGPPVDLAAHQAERARMAVEARAAREGKRDTITPTDPSAPTLDARVERLWHEKVAAAQEAGQDARHCHGEKCMDRGEGIALCDCRCEGCGRLLALLISAERAVRRGK